MTKNGSSESWYEDFLHPSKQHCHLLKKYRTFLSTIFKFEILMFNYGQWLQNNDLALMFDTPLLLECYLETISLF